MVRATRLTASTFGVLAGIGGFTHGIGEVRQGNVSTGGFAFESWADEPIATNLGGEPAVSIVPNMLVTGVLTMLVSVAVIVWAVTYPRWRHGDIVLLSLLVVMLLVGGGGAPPIFGLVGASAALGALRSHPRRDSSTSHMLARIWPWVFGLSAAIGLFLVFGSVGLVYIFDLNRPELFSTAFLVLLPILIVTVAAALAHDAVDVRAHAVASRSPAAPQAL